MSGREYASSPLAIRLFGPLDVQIEGRPLPRLHARKGYWLLALLVLHHDQEVARDWLAGTLWPDSSESDALHNLRMSLSNLRRALGEQAGRLHSPTTRLLQLDLQGAQVDLLDFNAAIERGGPAALEQAVSLYRGRLLEDCTAEWVLQERQSCEQSYLQALEKLAAQAAAEGDQARAVQRLRQIIAIDPLREEAQRALLEALAAQGDFAATTQAYRDLRLLLHRELHVEPSQETTALYERLRALARRRSLASDVARPPLAAPPPSRRLPQPLTPLVGREEAARDVAARLRQVRLVTLTGSGGVGKTRLAIAVAETVIENFPDGVWFVDLAPLSDPALVVATIASVLEVREEPDEPLLKRLMNALRSQALLLVLDNCEHLLDACAQAAAALLEGCEHVRVLATSRQLLGLTGELVWRVPSLGLPDLSGLLVEEKNESAFLMEYDAVRLFVERAALLQPTFRLTARDLQAAAQICVRLDGIPLAIELAAARVRALPVGQICARLDDRFQLLTGGDRAALPRQQTLQATLDWSYDLLTEPEKTLLRRLSVFAGGWTLEAAEAVCAVQPRDGREEREKRGGCLLPEDILNVTSCLVDKSLVMPEEREGQARYRLLETVRQYSHDRLVRSAEEGLMRRRHLDWCLALALGAEKQFHRSDQSVWFEVLEREHDNLRAALLSCLEEQNLKPKIEWGLRLAGALTGFWQVRGYAREGRGWLETFLVQEGEAAPAVRAKAFMSLALLQSLSGDQDRVLDLYERSLVLYEQLDDKAAMAKVLLEMSSAVYFHLRNPERTIALQERSLALFREIDDTGGVAAALINLGSTVRDQGDPGRAAALYEQSLALHRRTGDQQGISRVLSEIGYLLTAQGEFSRATEALEEALQVSRAQNNKISIGHILWLLGRVKEMQREYPEAVALFEEAAATARASGNLQQVINANGNLGLVAELQQDFTTALRHFTECLAVAREMRNRWCIASSLLAMGKTALQLGDAVSAHDHCRQSLSILREGGSRQDVMQCLLVLAEVAAICGQAERAARLIGAFETGRLSLTPDPPTYAPDLLPSLRRLLGDQEFERLRAEGRALMLTQAIDFALQPA